MVHIMSASCLGKCQLRRTGDGRFDGILKCMQVSTFWNLSAYLYLSNYPQHSFKKRRCCITLFVTISSLSTPGPFTFASTVHSEAVGRISKANQTRPCRPRRKAHDRPSLHLNSIAGYDNGNVLPSSARNDADVL